MKNNIIKVPVENLGYGFIDPKNLPKGKDEYYLRNIQNRNGIKYRQLTAYEIEVLVRNRNTSDNWNNILVSNAFTPELVKNCKFYGLVRIGKLEPFYLEFSKMKAAVGLYNSTIISCDFGDNVVIDNVNYMSHYIIGSEAIVINVNELMTTPHAKFGNGILKEGEPESIRIWIEIANENSGRQVIPFVGMLPGDAWLWSKYRDNDALLKKFKEFTEEQFSNKKGFYGKIGDRTVIKNCAIIKDCWIGSDAYLKGANKLKNLTINSKPGARTQIGEGCEMVNGIIGFGCRAFYGVKAVRFVMSSNSQLKYGARLINAYLGDNATISCCEVLNSLIFPAHEQHHNNSFLCASVIMGQSNMAAGATIGSNHNSRANDGEIIAKRGFWPGLCVSLKHNSRFASFTMIAKGDYTAEMDIPLPFSLISQNLSKDELLIMPGYWFLYNMYALGRNEWKYVNRDKRPDKIQLLEFDYLAPDTINEMIVAMEKLECWVGKAYLKEKGLKDDPSKYQKTGKDLLLNDFESAGKLTVLADGLENSKRNAVVLKAAAGYASYRRMIQYYGTLQLIEWLNLHNPANLEELKQTFPKRFNLMEWLNIGGQLIPSKDVSAMVNTVTSGKLGSWDDLHDWYREEGARYPFKKAMHGLAALHQTGILKPNLFTEKEIVSLLNECIETRKWMVSNSYESRKKDYESTFRLMMYDSEKEMEMVLGKMEDNEFLQYEVLSMKKMVRKTNKWKKLFS